MQLFDLMAIFRLPRSEVSTPLDQSDLLPTMHACAPVPSCRRSRLVQTMAAEDRQPCDLLYHDETGIRTYTLASSRPLCRSPRPNWTCGAAAYDPSSSSQSVQFRVHRRGNATHKLIRGPQFLRVQISTGSTVALRADPSADMLTPSSATTELYRQLASLRISNHGV